jgi:hypothetical protein
VLTIAVEDQKQKEHHFRDMVFGLLDCSMVLFFFLPVFGQQGDGTVLSVSLLALTGIQNYLLVSYFAVVIGSVVLGIVTLALQNCGYRFWMRNKGKLSILLNAAGAFLFILSQQVYGAVYMLTFFIIKAWILLKKQ